MRVLLVACVLVIGARAQTPPERGEINGAKFRIDMPEKWNGGLVMYCHGYNPAPVSFEEAKSGPVAGVFLSQGYAFAQSGYAAGGWAIQEAVQDTEALRRYFISKHGAPKESYITGHSMGGFLTMLMMETFPNVYDGGLPLCGPLAAANWFMERRPFDMGVVFEYLFPGVLPPPNAVPASFALTTPWGSDLEKVLEGKPDKAADMRRFSGIRTNKEVALTMALFTYILKDLRERAGGNPFDNTSTIYEGTSDDNALNDGVKRYKADPGAADYLAHHYTPTGKLTHPMLAIHTTYDPLVPPGVPNMYAQIVEQAGRSSLFAQQYVKHAGHCSIAPEEIGKGFAELREWKANGKRPQAGEVK
jgi:pimeloyl-ACP methyl ester carboxylesterase